MQQESASVGQTQEFDSEAVAEWVAETAHQKQVSKQTLIEELLSSYQVLQELSGVLEASEQTNTMGQRRSEISDTDHREASATRQSTDGETPARSAGFAELKAELQNLQTAIESLAEDQQSQSDDPETESGFLWLETQFEQFSSAASRQHAETASTVQRLAEQIGSITQQVDAIESTLDSERSLSELEAALQELDGTQTALDRRLESEFDNIERVLQHLLETDDDIEQRLAELREDRQRALEPLRQHRGRQNELTDLKHEAIRHGLSKAVCESCGLAIELGLLESPHCPGCKRRFVGIENGGPLPFPRATLQTAARPR